MPDVDGESGLEYFFWKGQKRYRCPIVWEGGNRCEWDHPNLTDVWEHMRAPHTFDGKPASPQVVERSPIVDPAGQPIYRESESPGTYRFKK